MAVKVGMGTFARLKLRILRNGFRGRTGKVILFVIGLSVGLFYSAMACLGFIAVMVTGEPTLTLLVPAFGGTLLVLGWLLLPLVWFGVDDTLDPSRFALLPLSRWTLLRGLLVGALLGVPALATLLAAAGLAIGTAIAAGPGPAAVSTVGVLLGLLLCVVGSRAVTSGFSRGLQSRRTRDLAAVMLALIAASIGPLQLLLTSGAQKVGTSRLEPVAQALGWTPLGAPFVLGTDAIAGRWLGVLAKLGIVLVTLALLLWWWSSSLESAMLGATGSSGPVRTKDPLGTPVARLFGRSRLPRTVYGALVRRELRYWARDARRRANLITFAVLAVFIPVVMNVGSAAAAADASAAFDVPVLHLGSMLFLGALAAMGTANQFGYDGTAYATNVVVGVPGQLELRSRAVAFSWLIVPTLVVLAGLTALLRQSPGQVPLLLGTLLASYGAGLACCMLLSVFAAYALPETQNPFAVNTGSGVAKSLLAMAGWFGGMLLASPITLLSLLGDTVGPLLALPVGLAYGVGAARLGIVIAGDVLDRRQPELLQAVTPRG